MFKTILDILIEVLPPGISLLHTGNFMLYDLFWHLSEVAPQCQLEPHCSLTVSLPGKLIACIAKGWQRVSSHTMAEQPGGSSSSWTHSTQERAAAPRGKGEHMTSQWSLPGPEKVGWHIHRASAHQGMKQPYAVVPYLQGNTSWKWRYKKETTFPRGWKNVIWIILGFTQETSLLVKFCTKDIYF